MIQFFAIFENGFLLLSSPLISKNDNSDPTISILQDFLHFSHFILQISKKRLFSPFFRAFFLFSSTLTIFHAMKHNFASGFRRPVGACCRRVLSSSCCAVVLLSALFCVLCPCSARLIQHGAKIPSIYRAKRRKLPREYLPL